MSKHSKRSPSKISRIIKCPGSPDFIKYLTQKGLVPTEDTSTYADEGSMMHKQIELKVLESPYTEKLDAEQENAIESAHEFLQDLRATHNLTWLQTERHVSLKEYGIPDGNGTADIVSGCAKRTLHILDWKFGKGVPVYVDKNEQLMDYLLGAGENYEKLKTYEELWIHLAQPRLNYYGSYQCNIDELMGLINAIKNSEGCHDIVAGEVQCFWCQGKVRCSEYNKMADSAAASVFQVNELMRQNEHDFADTVKLLEFEPFLKKVFKAIRDEFNIMDNSQLASIKLKRVAGRSNRSFVSEESLIKYLLENYEGVDDIYDPPKLKSPSKLEQTVKGLKKDPEFKKLIYKPLGKPTIVSVNDKRELYENDAKSTFAHLVKE